MRAEILELLRTQGAAAASCLKPLRDELNTREDPEEIARRELLALASMSNDKFKAAVDALDPTISKGLCIERGWPMQCFTACDSGRRCMKALATRDGDLFDDLLERMREGHSRAEADAETPRAVRAKQILHGSVWRHDMAGIASP